MLSMKNVWIDQGIYINGSILTANFTDAQSDFLTNGGRYTRSSKSLVWFSYATVNSLRLSCSNIDERIKDNIRDINDETAKTAKIDTTKDYTVTKTNI